MRPEGRKAGERIGRSAGVGDLSNMDPHLATNPYNTLILLHLYSRLFTVRHNSEGRPVIMKALVDSFRQVSPTEWEFRLRPNLRFHDGRPLTARDVKASLERAIKIGPIPRALLREVERVELVDDLTFRIVLKRPVGYLPARLAHPALGILPEGVAAKYWERPIDDPKAMIGSGIFRMGGIEGNKVIVERGIVQHGVDIPLARIEFNLVPDDETRLSLVEAHAVDASPYVPLSYLPRVEEKGLQKLVVPSSRSIFVGINVRRVSDVRVRWAMNMAVNREAIVKELLLGAATVASSPLPHYLMGSALQRPYVYSPETARELLEEAGWLGRELLLISPRGRYFRDAEVAGAVKGYLEEVGLKVKLELHEWPGYMKVLMSREDYDLFLLGWSTVTLDVDFGLSWLFMKDGRLNRMGYENPLFEELMERARREGEGSSYYAAAQRIVWEDAPAIFLYTEHQMMIFPREGEAETEEDHPYIREFDVAEMLLS